MTSTFQYILSQLTQMRKTDGALKRGWEMMGNRKIRKRKRPVKGYEKISTCFSIVDPFFVFVKWVPWGPIEVTIRYKP